MSSFYYEKGLHGIEYHLQNYGRMDHMVSFHYCHFCQDSSFLKTCLHYINFSSIILFDLYLTVYSSSKDIIVSAVPLSFTFMLYLILLRFVLGKFITYNFSALADADGGRAYLKLLDYTLALF